MDNGCAGKLPLDPFIDEDTSYNVLVDSTALGIAFHQNKELGQYHFGKSTNTKVECFDHLCLCMLFSGSYLPTLEAGCKDS